MNIIFDTHIGSRVNGTAGADSDHDTYYVYTLPTHSPEVLKNKDQGFMKGDRKGIPLHRFLRDCLMGEPMFVDLLYLPDSAYIQPLPTMLLDNRDMFIHRTMLDRYVAMAERMKGYATNDGGWKPLYAYYSLMPLNSARRILTTGKPAYYDPEFVPTLQVAHDRRMSRDDYLALYDGIKAEIESLPNELPRMPQWSRMVELYGAILAEDRPQPSAVLQVRSRRDERKPSAPTKPVVARKPQVMVQPSRQAVQRASGSRTAGGGGCGCSRSKG